ncbi:MAG TPA: cation:proton antiporter [Gemmatimonadota bacterium]|nr:cation:proton antiporter [Gemmatimonadota bacterium]
MHSEAPLIVQTVAIAIAVGVLAQVVAHRVRLPSIIFLLLFGVVAGPDVLGWIDTQVLGVGLQAIVTVAVALILFEGGLQLHYLDLAAVGRTVRNLVTTGAVVTVVGAALAAHWVAGFKWEMALLFGAIVSVTGPTVINPLLDRVRVTRRMDTILRGEGILIDPIGAILALVVLELIISTETAIWQGFAQFLTRMAIGAAIGLAGGWTLGRVLRVRRLIGDELKNIVVLASVMALFALAEWLAAESGLAAVVIAGMTVRRESIPQEHHLRRFKSELSVLFISILFILLSAHLPLGTLAALGWSGVWTVLILMLVVRPLNVLASTSTADLTWRERLFVMAISPRGVVAISIASFIAIRIEAGSPAFVEAGLTPLDGERFLALVFLTIAITVVVQGIAAGPLSRQLGVDAETSRYAVVVGGNPLGRLLGTLLQQRGWDVLLIDANLRHVQLARAVGLTAIEGNVLDHAVLGQARLESANALVTVTANQAVNFLVARLARDEYHVPGVYPVQVDVAKGVHEERISEMGGELAFGRRINVQHWNLLLAEERVRLVELEAGEEAPRKPLAELDLPDGMLPLMTIRGQQALVCHGAMKWQPEDRIVALVDREGEAALVGLFGSGAVAEIETGLVPVAGREA